jgi:ABC-type dipeptide/oligopeptide/nickel transport system ATPase component
MFITYLLRELRRRMRQAIFIAAGLALGVGLVITVTARDEIMTLLEKLWRELGLTLVVVTHDSYVARMAQRTGFMENGRLTRQVITPGRAKT